MVRKRFLTERAKFLEMRVFEGQSSSEIFGRLKQRIIEETRDSPRVRALRVDTGVLDVLGPQIDWVAITQLNNLDARPGSRAAGA